MLAHLAKYTFRYALRHVSVGHLQVAFSGKGVSVRDCTWSPWSPPPLRLPERLGIAVGIVTSLGSPFRQDSDTSSALRSPFCQIWKMGWERKDPRTEKSARKPLKTHDSICLGSLWVGISYTGLLCRCKLFIIPSHKCWQKCVPLIWLLQLFF